MSVATDRHADRRPPWTRPTSPGGSSRSSTVYHFLFVPMTIGLSAIVAGYETAWLRTGNEQWLRLTKFFGKLFLINFAMGVVTGIVQEFQFGMNWSDYSRFVGDVFGAPLAIEGLLAFFLESTFLGLWIFGWDRLPRGCTLACIVARARSAPCCRRTSSWPPTRGCRTRSGYALQPRHRPAELTDFGAVLTNKVQLVTFPHTILAAFMAGAALPRRRRRSGTWRDATPTTDRADVPHGGPHSAPDRAGRRHRRRVTGDLRARS